MSVPYAKLPAWVDLRPDPADQSDRRLLVAGLVVLAVG
jgi:hypothetical protein